MDLMENTGLHALVLGASSGLGKASTEKMAREGWTVWAVFRERRAQHKTLVGAWDKHFGNRIVPLNLNALDPKDRADCIATMQAAKGKLALLLHSISRGNPGFLLPKLGQKTLTEADLNLTLNAMATNWLMWVQELFAAGLFAPQAVNLAFTSMGNNRMLPGYAAIGMAKAALETLGKYMAVEFMETGIRTNLIQAGVTPTPALKFFPDLQEKLLSLEESHPGGRLSTPEDAANVVYLLTRQEASWINGAIIPVDGGETLI